MNEKKTDISLILSIAAICISVAAIALCLVQSFGNRSKMIEKDDVQYVLYLGVDDRNTGKPVYSHDDAKKVLEEILAKRMGGYTVLEAEGGWVGDDNTEYQGYTLVISLSDTTPEKVHALCDELLERFDQSCILIKTDKSTTQFYRGS